MGSSFEGSAWHFAAGIVVQASAERVDFNQAISSVPTHSTHIICHAAILTVRLEYCRAGSVGFGSERRRRSKCWLNVRQQQIFIEM